MCQSFSDLFVLQALDYLEEMTMAPFAAFGHVPKTNLVLSSAVQCYIQHRGIFALREG